MSKQPTFNGIDYTPKKPRDTRPMDRVIQGTVQRTQRAPFFEVTCGGKCVEFTDLRGTAHAVYHSTATLPKQLTMVDARGHRRLLAEVDAFGHERGMVPA